MRWFLAMTLCACTQTQTLHDRIAELNDQATVDCGEVGEVCTTTERIEEVVACMRNNLAAGIDAKARQRANLDTAQFVYAIDGAFLWLKFSTHDEEQKTWQEEWCGDFVITAGTCPSKSAKLGGTGCE